MPFEIPEDITALDDVALAAALEAALEEAGEFESVPDDELDQEKFDRLLALADFATAAKDAQSERATVAAERSGRAQAARAALTKPVVEDVVDAEVIEDAPAEETKEQPKEAVAASAGKRVAVVARVASKTSAPIDITPSRPSAVLTASADVPGFATGGALNDLDAVGKAMTARMRGLPTARIGGEDGVQMRYSVAQIDKGATRTDGLVQDNDDDQSLLARASREARLPGGSLTAAGGWCAPSEVLYDLCSIESTDGLLDLPSVTVNRGGIRYTKGPTFSEIYAAAGGWVLTEAQVIAGTPAKTCLDVTCPPFVEARLDAIGLCIKAPLLTQAAYPELVRRWIEGALIAHQHIVDANLIGRIVAGSTALEGPGGGTTTIDSLTELELVASYQRQSWRMSFNETLEVLAPYWYKTIIRGDLSRRTGVDLINVTDAQIEAYFTARNLRVQWLYNYQPLTAAAGAVVVPTNAQVVMYPAGAWVKGTTDVISLDAVYDSQNLLLNQYTALFVEEGVLVANVCFDSVKVNLNTCASGQTGAADLTDCLIRAGA